ncbi:hypothetical protein J6590_053159 [Homalodisca vitripennis]|nr:hypothetical protein J6590_053159 [Homalodisca vitripennis]
MRRQRGLELQPKSHASSKVTRSQQSMRRYRWSVCFNGKRYHININSEVKKILSPAPLCFMGTFDIQPLFKETQQSFVTAHPAVLT